MKEKIKGQTVFYLFLPPLFSSVSVCFYSLPEDRYSASSFMTPPQLHKDGRGQEEVITAPEFLAPSDGETAAHDEREGNVPSPSPSARQWQISTPAVSQRMKRCLLTSHRKAERAAAAAQKEKKKSVLFVLAGT